MPPSSDSSSDHWLIDRLDRAFPWLLALPLVISWLLMGTASVNIPHADDYDVFLRHLNLPTAERWGQMLGFHNEHRLGLPRLVAEAQLALFGELSFPILAAVGHLALSALLLPLWWIFRRTGSPRIYFLPIPYLLLLSPYWENMTWATGGLQNHGALWLSVTALWLHGRHTRGALLLSWLSAGLAVITSGHGLFAWLVLCLSGCIDAVDRRRLPGAGWVLTCLLTVIIFSAYFHGYSRPSHHPGLEQTLENPLRAGLYFFTFLGSYLRPEALAIAAGLGAVLLWLYLALRPRTRRSPAFSLALYVLLNAAAATASRSALGLHQALSSRYASVSILLLIAVYLLLHTDAGPAASVLRPLPRPLRASLTPYLPVCLLILAMAYGAIATTVNARAVFQRRADLVAGMRADPKLDGAPALDAPGTFESFRAVLAEAERQGIYRRPAADAAPGDSP